MRKYLKLNGVSSLISTQLYIVFLKSTHNFLCEHISRLPMEHIIHVRKHKHKEIHKGKTSIEDFIQRQYTL